MNLDGCVHIFVYGKAPGYFEDGMMLILACIGIPSRELTYPTIGKGKSSTKKHLRWGYVGVSKNSGTPKSSILIGFSTINHPFWGTPIFGNTHVCSLGVSLFSFN